MARSYFALFPGILPPANWKAINTAELLTISDVWEAARKSPPSLLFRVRSESDPGAMVTVEDRLESCVGAVDAVSRWRSVWVMSKPMLNAIRHPALKSVAGQAMQFVSTQHPANVSQDQRLQMIENLVKLAEGDVEGQPKAGTFEKQIAYNIARLVSADNDIEASHYIPFVDVLNPFNPETQRAEYQGRMASIETMSGAVILTEAAARLGERAPQWIAAVPPALEIAAGDTTPPRDRESDEG